MTLFDRVFNGNDYNYDRTVKAIEEIRKIKEILDRDET